MKLTIVGGGSTYTPELIDGFARLRDTLPISEIHLVDQDERRLALVGGMASRMLARRVTRPRLCAPQTWWLVLRMRMRCWCSYGLEAKMRGRPTRLGRTTLAALGRRPQAPAG